MADTNPWKPDPRDNRTPIGAPDTTVSMHRRCTLFSQAIAAVEHQPRQYSGHMIIGRVLERLMGKLHGIGKEVVGFVFCHGGIVSGAECGDHSRFPRVISMSSSSLFFDRRGQSNAV